MSGRVKVAAETRIGSASNIKRSAKRSFIHLIISEYRPLVYVHVETWRARTLRGNLTQKT
jgi:hypothetical protein